MEGESQQLLNSHWGGPTNPHCDSRSKLIAASSPQVDLGASLRD